MLKRKEVVETQCSVVPICQRFQFCCESWQEWTSDFHYCWLFFGFQVKWRLFTPLKRSLPGSSSQGLLGSLLSPTASLGWRDVNEVGTGNSIIKLHPFSATVGQYLCQTKVSKTILLYSASFRLAALTIIIPSVAKYFFAIILQTSFVAVQSCR